MGVPFLYNQGKLDALRSKNNDVLSERLEKEMVVSWELLTAK